jgi:hypothetical protein
MIKLFRGALVEYALSIPTLVLLFEFNPTTITRTRTVAVKTGGTPTTHRGYDFLTLLETPRASQGVNVQSETLSFKILLDATDRMNQGDTVASVFGIQPEIDTIRCMLEPKTQTPGGAQTLSSLGLGSQRAFSRNECAPVLLFVWGLQILPVFMTQAKFDIKEYLPTLIPYRAEVDIELQVIESNNPFYSVETIRQIAGAAMNTANIATAGIQGLF